VLAELTPKLFDELVRQPGFRKIGNGVVTKRVAANHSPIVSYILANHILAHSLMARIWGARIF
jgi:hypothetical protein